MLSCPIDELRRRYPDGCVKVDGSRPELARFAGVPGRVKTVNQSGRALVQFEGADRAWYDIPPEHLVIVEPQGDTPHAD